MSIINGSTLLITGGTGSFGRKCVETLLSECKPKKVIVFSRDELKQHEMRQRFSDMVPGAVMRYFIGDVRDVNRLRRAMHGVDIVIHAAALKQVPACEYNPFEAIQTNIIGAKNIIDAAIDCGVKRVLALSTDKAVNPVNLYGATKLCAEKLFVHGNAYSGAEGTRFACARYGNVVGSRGSVIPIFLKQRELGKVTITDPEMTRFWLTLEQGVHFVINAIESMHGGEIFVPKIPVMNIMDLYKAIAPECEAEFIGIRPGEKMHEVLVSEDEARHTVELDGMYVILPNHPWWSKDKWAHAKPVGQDFRYTSDNCQHRLTKDELLELVSAL
jgi:UDP-N-acetylglucosamine 4,6-dehydratase